MFTSVYDGTTSFLGGQNAGIAPDLIGETQFAKGINLTIKEGNLTPRPGVDHFHDLTFLTTGGITAPDGSVRLYSDIYRTGKFQGAGPYIVDEGIFIIAIISGIVFKIDPAIRQVTVLDVEIQTSDNEPKSERLDQYSARHNWVEAGQYFAICDYPDDPIILEGGKARRVDRSKYEIPLPAVLLTYNQNRLFAFSNVHEFLAGDPVGNRATPFAPITFEEVFAPASAFLGQSFSLGSTNLNNPITAAGYFPRVDGSTEIGALYVATKKSLYGFQTTLERAAWEQTSFGSEVLTRAGIAGQRAHIAVHSDVWFMGGDGRIRSFSVARNDQQQWGRSPLDKEVQNWIRFCDPSLIQYTTCAYHNNRIFFSVNPFVTTAFDLSGEPVSDVAFRGMVVLELDPISGFAQAGSPAWAGLWTGINPMEFVEIGNDLYVFAKELGDQNTLFRLQPDDITWDTWEGKRKQIVSRIELKQYSFAHQGLNYSLKEEQTVFPGVHNIGGEFSMTIERRNDNYPNYLTWRTLKYTAPIDRLTAGQSMTSLVPHSFRELNFGDPEDITDNDFNPISREQFRYFNATQFRLTVTGLSWKLKAFRVKAGVVEDRQEINICELPDNVELDITPSVLDFDLYSVAPTNLG